MSTLTYDQRQSGIRRLSEANPSFPAEFATGYFDGMVEGMVDTLDYVRYHNKTTDTLGNIGYRSAWTTYNARLCASRTFTARRCELPDMPDVWVCGRCQRVAGFVNEKPQHHLCVDRKNGGGR